MLQISCNWVICYWQQKLFAGTHDNVNIYSHKDSRSADVTCATGYKLNPYRDTCIRFVRESLSWFDAKATCEKSGEFLATFDTVESASWVRHQQLTAGRMMFSSPEVIPTCNIVFFGWFYPIPCVSFYWHKIFTDSEKVFLIAAQTTSNILILDVSLIELTQ